MANGLRAQVRNGNLLTGQLYIAMEFDPKAPKVAFNAKARPLEIPTVPGSFDKLQEQLQAFVEKLSNLPIDQLAGNLNGTLSELQKTLKQVNSSVLPQMRGTLQQAEKPWGLPTTRSPKIHPRVSNWARRWMKYNVPHVRYGS